MFKKILLIFIIFIFALPVGLKAFEVTSVGNNLLAEVKPASPGPGEQVTISLAGYGFDLDASMISWSVNDELKMKSIGIKTFSFNLGPVGRKTKIGVIVITSGNRQLTKTFIFDPTEIELFWETKTSHPLFYQGKALPSAGAELHFTAWPYLVNQAGQRISPANLNYQWEKDGVAITSISGLGKNSATITTNPKASQVKISVKVTSSVDKITATKSLVINLIKPEVIFYEKKPLEGVNYNQIFPAEYSLFDDEVTVRAEPYFLPLGTDLSFKYLWMVDQSKAESRPDDPLMITLRRSQNTSGLNRVNFLVQAEDLNLTNSFVVKYGNSLLKPQF